MSDLYEEIAARQELPAPKVRRLRRETVGPSRARCAEELGVTQETFGRWERGDRTPRGDQLVAYVAMLRRFQELVS